MEQGRAVKNKNFYLNDNLKKDDNLKKVNLNPPKTNYASEKNISLSNFTVPADSNQQKPSSFIINADTSNPFRNAVISELSAETKQDTLDQMSIDSTARLKFFYHKRRDVPYTTLRQKRLSPFFISPPQGIRTRTVEIDSTGKFVNIIEKTAGEKSKIILTMPLEDYIKMSMKLRQRENWEELGYDYQLKDNEKQLSDVIKDITDFEIPLPSVGVLSIFGKPKISLRIGGAVDIHGAWRNETTEGITTSLLGNTRNEPDFRQTVQINVNGTIGDKLNISADWNTERTFEYENQLKIKYTGYEDEIIQSIEAGNVSLQTSPLVGGSEALFGLKANFQLGPLSLTTLASQKKGETKEVSVSSGATSQPFEIRAYNYSTNNYFLDTIYASTKPEFNTFEKYYNNSPAVVIDSLRVVDIEVWKSITTPGRDPAKERIANAYLNLPPISAGQTYDNVDPNLRKQIQGDPGQSETGRFLLLTPNVDYTLQPETGYITFKTTINDNDAIAVAYRREGPPGSSNDRFYGEFLGAADSLNRRTGDSTLVLKLVKPSNLQPSYKEAWRLLLKNIYSIGGRNINKEGFEFNIKYELEGQDPVAEIGSTKFLQAFGFDEVNASGSPPPDDIFDWDPGRTIFPETGEIVFPTLEPFGKNLPNEISDSLSYQDVYDTTVTAAQQVKVKDKWVLTGKYSAATTSIYQLGFNVVENSVRVTLDGRELTQGIDYTVDYNTGQLTIRNDDALVPGKNLKITYEQNDLFSLASKTLLGARGVFDISKKTKLGFSILNLSQQTLSDKVRIGEEPLSNTIYGVDLSTSGDLPFLTNALDNIISTRQMSSFTLTGEYAYMNPDPNTKKSTIASDQGNSIAYIDDFEGSKRIIPIGVSYIGWKDLSAPDDLPLLKDTSYVNMMKYKAKSFWFTQTPSNVNVQDIWGDKKRVAREDQQVPVLDYVFLPDTAGTYNYQPNLSVRERNWGGMMKSLSSTASNLVDENIEFIELWINGKDTPPGAKVYIDLGRISEDVIPNQKLDTEDKNNNDLLDPGEDLGIDGLTDEQERAKFNSTKADPSGDNFSFIGNSSNVRSIFDYFNNNGTQGNGTLIDNGRIPDTEDLNRNGSVDLVNSYFRYEIPLDTNRQTNPFIAGGGDGKVKDWHLYRIPLKDTLLKVGDPVFTNVQYIRFFVTGVNQMTHVRIAEFNLVGNQWQKAMRNDSLMEVSVVNVEDNPNYTLPPGLTRATDKTRPDQNILLNEQSLNLIFHGLPEGEYREAVKYLYQPLDVFNYKEMKLFVHGDENNTPGSISYTDSAGYSSEVSFRFGTDTNNYYEYRRPVSPGWNEISISFKDITAIKQLRGDSVNAVILQPVPGKPGHFYKVKGQPSLTSIRFLTVGVTNLNNNFNPGPLSGEVWINELRVVGADDKPGWAYNVGGSLKLADLMTVNFNMSETDPNFHRLSDRFGSRVLSRNWNIQTNLDVLKLLPFKLKDSNLKVDYSHTESIGKPKYFPGTDIEVESAASLAEEAETDSVPGIKKTAEQIRGETQSVNVSDSWAASNIQLKIPSSYWLIRDTWNALSFAFNYNKRFSRSPTVLSNKSWVWNASASYAVNLSQDYFIYPANIPVIGAIIGLFTDYRNVKVFFTPQTISFNLRAQRNRNINVTRARVNTPSQQIISRDFTAQRGFNVAWKITQGGLLNLSTNYNVNINSSLLYLETDQSGRQRSSSEIFADIFGGQFFGKDYGYQQTLDIKTSPVLPSLWDINKYFTITAGYSVTYQWQNDFRQAILGRSAGYSARSSAGLTLKLQSLMEPLFSNLKEKEENEPQNNNIPSQSRGQRNFQLEEKKQTLNEKENLQDSLKTENKEPELKDSTTALTTKKKHPLKNALLFFESAVKFLLFDYETITFNFSNTKSLSKNGILGEGTGLGNFWGFSQNFKNGPTRSFMVGLSGEVGPRAPNGNLQDVFSENNKIDFSTSRPLWEGAKIDLDWSVGWTLNKRTTIQTDADGNLFVNNISSTGTLTRSFLSIPPVLIFSALKTGIKQVHELDPDAVHLNDSFIEGFETFPWLAKLGFLKDFSRYIPRPNWNIRWDGLEKFPLFSGFAKSVSLTSAYQSTYSEGWKITPDGAKQIQTQRITYGFAPLASISFTFGEVFGGNLVSSVKYSTNTNYDLGTSTKNITETFSRDIGITAGYSKSGFELPIFGISLKNDIEFTFSYTSSKNSIVNFDMENFTEQGTPQDGTTRTTFEPRVKYTLSSKVTLSLFYRRSTVEPEGASRITPTTTNEAGLDVHISIQ